MRGQACHHFRKWLCFGNVIICMFHSKNTGLIEVDEIKNHFSYFGPTWILHPLKGLFHSQLNSLSLSFVVQSLSHVWLFVTPWTAAHQASLSSSISWSLLNLMSTESVMPSNHLILCYPLLLPIQSFPALGSFPMSRLFALGGQNIGSFSISPSNEYSGLISFRIGWFESLAVQGTLKSVLQHHS